MRGEPSHKVNARRSGSPVLDRVVLTFDAWAQINLLGVDISIEARRRRITGTLLLF